jgi:ABC-type spermidine/putrescine transport system permease subunit II
VDNSFRKSVKVKALQHLMIADLSGTIATCYCAKLLADYGAKIFNFESEDGFQTRSIKPFIPGTTESAMHGYLNTNKKSVCGDVDADWSQFDRIFLNQNLTELKFIKSLFFFPFVVSPVVVGLIFSWFYNPKYGLLDSFLEFIGLNSLAVLSNENIVTFGIIIAALWPQIAYCLILYLTGLAGLNKEIVEAAKIDGAKGWSMFWNVILPQLRPATFIAIIVSVLGALRSFDLVAIMTRGGPWGSSTVLAYEMVEQAIFNYRMGYGAALATILFLILDIYIAWFLIRVWLNEKGRL